MKHGQVIPIFKNFSPLEFEIAALEIFREQYQSVKVYHDFVNYLNIDPKKVTSLIKIPFLPVELFRTRKIIARDKKEQLVFTSSGTTSSVQSHHYVADLLVYEKSFTGSFRAFYGPVSDYCILALLPAYLERTGSSLVYMADKLIQMSGHAESGFYLHEYEVLMRKLLELKGKGQKTLLLGVSFALAQLASDFTSDLSDIIIMETGGMKGMEKEVTRDELHALIKSRFQVNNVHSEYGMTELLSQAYSKGNGCFFTPPWMKVMVRDSHDPFEFLPTGKPGAINVIDLANIYSCCFLATSDLGKINPDGSFEILGRMDNSDIRGCNLLVAE